MSDSSAAPHGAAPHGAAPHGAAPPRAGRWRVLFTPRWLSWHLFAVATFVGMLWLGDWQFRRAISGNALSWAYTFEWPVFAVFGAVFWVKTIRDELHPSQQPEAAEHAEPADGDPAGGDPRPGESLAQRQLARTRSGQAVTDDDELSETEATELAEYNAYLAKLGKRQSIKMQSIR